MPRFTSACVQLAHGTKVRVRDTRKTVPGLRVLDERERKILQLRFFEGLTQSQIAAQVDDFEKKFARLEERLLKETADARAETKKRFDSLESFIRKEVESLAERIRGEHEERMEAGKDLSRELRETAKGLEKKLGTLDEQTTRNQRELRQQILDQSKALTEEIRTRVRESATALSKEIKELRAEKTDRTALAGP